MFSDRLDSALAVDRACVELLIERGSELERPLNLAACFNRVELVEPRGLPPGRLGRLTTAGAELAHFLRTFVTSAR